LPVKPLQLLAFVTVRARVEGEEKQIFFIEAEFDLLEIAQCANQ
jgi:hypothetical protein